MKKIFAITLMLSFTAAVAFAQTKRFTTSGTITFEKTINMYAVLEHVIDKDNEAFYKPALEEYKKNKPQFKKLNSTLVFSGNESLYTPGEDTQGSGFMSSAMSTQINTVYSDLNAQTTTMQKVVFEDKFLLKDTLRHINWKITDERREIAGYNCRRANAVILDSIYVVAFYTDEIPISSGPESFTGLPGMILGVALPHENVTWFATKLVDQPIPAAALKPPAKGKPTTYVLLRKVIAEAVAGGNLGKKALMGLIL